MKIAFTGARLLLGFIFLVFGLNGFLQFLPMPAPSGLAGQFMGALFASHELNVIFLFELAGAVLLLSGRYVPLALAVLGPVIANILFFHVFMAPAGLPLATLVTILWSAVFYDRRAAFAGLFEGRPKPASGVHRHELQSALR